MTRNTNRSTTVSNTRAEVANMICLVSTSKTEVIVFAINSDMLVVLLGKLHNSFFDDLHAANFTHGFGGVVGVATGAVPVSLKGFGVERDLDAPLLGNADEEITGHPEVVTHRNTFTGADLELPLRWHYFSINTADVDTSVETGTIVGLDKITSENLASP